MIQNPYFPARLFAHKSFIVFIVHTGRTEKPTMVQLTIINIDRESRTITTSLNEYRKKSSKTKRNGNIFDFKMIM